MAKNYFKNHKNLIPFFLTACISICASLLIFYGFSSIGPGPRFTQAPYTAAVITALQSDLSDGVSPFYRTASFSKKTPSDDDVVGVPTLNLRDRVLLAQSEGEVMVALYNKSEQPNGPLISRSIGNGNEQIFTAGDYGAGDFVVVTTQRNNCWDKPLVDCLEAPDKISEWRYTVVADTYTYILAPLEKASVARLNAQKALHDVDEVVDSPDTTDTTKGVIDTIKDVVTNLFGDSVSEVEPDVPAESASGGTNEVGQSSSDSQTEENENIEPEIQNSESLGQTSAPETDE